VVFWENFAYLLENSCQKPKRLVSLFRGVRMAVRVKPVQPTEIKDKKIAREVIEQIRKPIPASVNRRNRELADLINKMTRK